MVQLLCKLTNCANLKSFFENKTKQQQQQQIKVLSFSI